MDQSGTAQFVLCALGFVCCIQKQLEEVASPCSEPSTKKKTCANNVAHRHVSAKTKVPEGSGRSITKPGAAWPFQARLGLGPDLHPEHEAATLLLPPTEGRAQPAGSRPKPPPSPLIPPRPAPAPLFTSSCSQTPGSSCELPGFQDQGGLHACFLALETPSRSCDQHRLQASSTGPGREARASWFLFDMQPFDFCPGKISILPADRLAAASRKTTSLSCSLAAALLQRQPPATAVPARFPHGSSQSARPFAPHTHRCREMLCLCGTSLD